MRRVAVARAAGRGAVGVGPDAAHVIMGARAHFPRLLELRRLLAQRLARVVVGARQAGLAEALEIGPGERQFLVGGHVQIGAAVGAAAAVFDRAQDRRRAFGAGSHEDAVQDDLAVAVAQNAEITGHHRLAGAQALIGRRRGEAEGQELDLLHIHQVGAGAQGDGVPVAGIAAHGVGVREIEAGEAAGGDHHRRRAHRDQHAARRIVDQAAGDSLLRSRPVGHAFGHQIEEPRILDIVDAVALDDGVPVGVAERDAAVLVADRAPARVPAEGQGQGLRAGQVFLDRRAQALGAVAVVGGCAVLGERVGDRPHGEVASGHLEIFREHLFRIVLGARSAHRRDAFRNLGVGRADRVLGDRQHARPGIRRRPGRLAAGAAGADHDHVIVPPFDIYRHRESSALAPRRQETNCGRYSPRRRMRANARINAQAIAKANAGGGRPCRGYPTRSIQAVRAFM